MGKPVFPPYRNKTVGSLRGPCAKGQGGLVAKKTPKTASLDRWLKASSPFLKTGFSAYFSLSNIGKG